MAGDGDVVVSDGALVECVTGIATRRGNSASHSVKVRGGGVAGDGAPARWAKEAFIVMLERMER